MMGGAELRETGRVASVLLTLAMAAFLVGCGPAPATASPSPGPTHGPAHAESTYGNFHLAFDMPDTVVQSGYALEGTATFSVEGVTSAEIWAGGEPVMFSIAEVGGPIKATAPVTTDLGTYTLWTGSPITASIPPLQWFSPNVVSPELTPFPEGFFCGSSVCLPAGNWQATATLVFYYPGDPDHSNEHELRATISFLVVA